MELLNYSVVSLSTSFLTSGSISKLVGNPTMNPIIHPRRNLSKKPGVQPVIIVVMVKVIVESNANVMKKAVSNVECLLFINAVSLYERITDGNLNIVH